MKESEVEMKLVTFGWPSSVFIFSLFFGGNRPKKPPPKEKITPDTSGVSIDLRVGFSQGKGQKTQNKANPTSVK